jgi:hypothetical protein
MAMIYSYGFSLTGISHQKKGLPCQDAHKIVYLKNGWVAAAIADGLGSAPHSEKGSKIAVDDVTGTVAGYMPQFWDVKSVMALLHTGFLAAQNRIEKEAEKNNHQLEDYDTTLTAVVYNGRKIVFGHVGDGGILGLGSFGDLIKVTEVMKGDTHNETMPLRGGPEYWHFDYSEEEFSSILLLTDGMLDILTPTLLDEKIYINFARQYMDLNLIKLAEKGPDAVKEGLQTYTDKIEFVTDDKTVVALINTELMPALKDDAYYEEPDWAALKEERNKKLYPGLEPAPGLKAGLEKDSGQVDTVSGSDGKPAVSPRSSHAAASAAYGATAGPAGKGELPVELGFEEKAEPLVQYFLPKSKKDETSPVMDDRPPETGEGVKVEPESRAGAGEAKNEVSAKNNETKERDSAAAVGDQDVPAVPAGSEDPKSSFSGINKRKGILNWFKRK